jgi:type IV secretion system protein VirB9
MSKRLLSFLIALTLAGTAAHGAQLPESARKDKRIRFATYDAYDVVTIYTRIGMGTTILFEPDEKVVDMTGGDVEAWGAEVPTARNGVFLKPAAETADANLHIITSKRTYTLDLKLAQKSKGEVGFMTVYFRYPEARQAAHVEIKESEQVRTLLEAGSAVSNRRYTVQGASDLAPIEAWDDGRSTFLRFRARGSIPAVYAASDSDDSLEQIENISVKDDVVQVHGVRRKFVLRAGRQVACIFNEGFDPDSSRPATNTASPGVTRTLKGDGK